MNFAARRDMHGARQLLSLHAKAIFRDRLAEGAHKAFLELRQFDAVLGTLRSGHTRHHRAEVEFQFLRVGDFTFLGNAEQTLGTIIIFVNAAMLLAAARGAQIIHTFFVNRKEAHRRAVFGRHVRNRRPVHDRQRRRARSKKFHKLSDDFRLAQHLRDGQREVGRRDAFGQRAGQVHADDVRREKINRLAQHARLRLDAADAPADDAQAVDHRGVRIRADQRVGIEDV